MDLNKVRKALGHSVVKAGEPGTLDPAVPPHGGTHDTDVEIADDVVRLVDTNSPDTKDLETRAYESGTEDDGSADTPPYDGESSVDGIPTIPDTLAAAGDTAGDKQKNKGGGGPSVQLPDTLEDEVAVDPKDPHSHAAVALTTDDISDLRKIMAEPTNENVKRAVASLQWLDRNPRHAKRAQVEAGIDKWKPTLAQANEAQARYGFEFLHTEAAAAPSNAEKTRKVMSWLKKYVTAKKIAIAREFLSSEEAKKNKNLSQQIQAWLVEAVDQVTENKEDVGIDDITLYGPQNGSSAHLPGKEDDGFTEPKIVSVEDVPFKDPARHPAEAGSEVDEQTGSPAQDSEAVDSDSFKAKSHDRAKESNTPTAARKAHGMGMGHGMDMGQAMEMGRGMPEEVTEPPVPGMPPEQMGAPGEAPLPELPGMQPEEMGMPPEGMPPEGMPPEGMGMPPEGLPPVLPEGADPATSMGPMPGGGGGAPMAPAAGPDAGQDMGGMGQSLEEWLQEELMEPGHQDPAESAHVEMLSNFNEIGPVTTDDVVMALYGEDQENPHWNIDIKGRPVARVELSDQPKPEEVRSTFLSAPYAENIAQAMAKVGVSEVLQAINAKPYAAKVEIGELAAKIRAKVEAEHSAKYARAVGELRERFLTAAKIALSGYNSNFFRGEDHQLKAALWSELKRLGLRDAAGVIEASFEEGAVPFFESVLAKAEELMDLPDEAREAIAKAIPQSNALVTASADSGEHLPEHETLASVLESGNVPFTSQQGANGVTASRSEVRGGLRAKVQLSTFRSS